MLNTLLDRYPPTPIRNVFDNGSAQLLAPQMQVIYTIPLALTRDPNFNQILGDFRNQRMTLPVLPLIDEDGKVNLESRDIAHTIIQRRLPPELHTCINPVALEEMITKSGGLLSDLLLLMHSACLQASIDDNPKLSMEIARYSISERRKDFGRQLNRHSMEYFALLRNVQQRVPLDANEAFLDLLYQTSILEYENDDNIWNIVHPLVADLLTRG